MPAEPFRGKQAIKPRGWGMFSKKTGKLLAFHNSRDVVERWAADKPDVQVRRLK